jgi:CRISPR-associated protein Csd1
MIRELSDLGKRLRGEQAGQKWVHDALKEETISLVLTIRADGSFVSLQPIERKKTVAEAIQRTSGKEARLLVDNCGYVIGAYDPDSSTFKKKVKEKGESKAHEIFRKDVNTKRALFVQRLKEIGGIEELEPAVRFYGDNKERGIDLVSQEYFLKTISKKNRSGNVAILISDGDKYAHECESVYHSIIATYEKRQLIHLAGNKKKCAVCRGEEFPVGDFTHYHIKGVPGDNEPAGGRKLISYNGDNNPFESYEMVGNENSMICTNCAKTYVEGLNWLLSDGIKIVNKRNKEDIVYTHRWPRKRSQSYGVDTAMVFWTRENEDLPEIDQLEAPNPDEVSRLIESVATGKEKDSRYLETDQFYSFTLSGASARIAIRDWIESSLYDFRKAIGQWFKDIAIETYDFELKKFKTHYARLYDLARSCQRKNSNDSYDKEDASLARTAVYLWNAALKNNRLPLWMLTKTLHRVRMDNTGVSPDRAALIKLILNRNGKGGGFMVTERMEEGQKPVAYVCGQIFAKLESIQYAAIGDRNAGIRERYFTYAMTSPSSAFGRLFNLNSKHFTKLKSEKPGLAVTLDKELQELCRDVPIERFPANFSLEEQGQFAIGYYHQRQRQFSSITQN